METNTYHLLCCAKIWTTITIILVFGVTGLDGECPHLCECKWKSGKESVLCLNANLNGIPTELDAGTQVLDLKGNEVSSIPHDAFSRANLLNLQKLFITKCRLKVIERFAFRKLTNLVELDVSYNQLPMIPSHAFESIAELRELKLVGNPIHTIMNDAFLNLPHLERLELTDCKIHTIEIRGFDGLENSLEVLKLDRNKLVDIHPKTLMGLQNLNNLELASNPWNCTCNLRPVIEWIAVAKIAYTIPPVCKTPERISERSWDKIDLDEYACMPTIVAAEAKANGVEGKNITMSCIVGGVPEPKVKWMFRNRLIANLTANAVVPAAQGRKLYVVNLQPSSSNLTILVADMQDAGVYTCVAENKAGLVEANIALAVSKKPPEGPFSAKMLLAGVVVAALFIVASSLALVCVFTLRKRRKIGRWNTQGRCESYEKIELNNKPNNNRGAKSPRGDRTGFMKPYAENGIAVVGHVKRNGDYRTVPSEDDGTGLEDNSNNDGSNVAMNSIKRDSILRWKGTPGKNACSELWKEGSDALEGRSSRPEDTDLHIPRLIEFSDATPDSGPSSLAGQYDQTKSTGMPIGSEYGKTSWTHHIIRKQSSANTMDNVQAKECHTSNDSRISDNSDFEGDRKFPDLLDIASVSNTSMSSAGAANLTAATKMTNSAFCTFPRKKYHGGTRATLAATSDSQSPLIQDTSSRYGSDNFSETTISSEILGRRMSVESSQSQNYLLSIYPRTTKPNGRSSSFLNLVIAQTSNNNQKRNPSLPSSPSKDAQKLFSPHETPLLDFTSLSRKQMIATPSPSTSTTTPANAYDYHAAQLERFLEEYRNLQEQLCKMKETCDSIRKKEVPQRSTMGQSAKYADPVMYSAALGATATLSTSPGEAAAADVTAAAAAVANPKSILRGKALPLPGQPPDPPPYWLHRNTMLKRLQEPGNEFYNS